MFFLPFVGSSICDSLVIYLYSTLTKFKKEIINDGTISGASKRFTNILLVFAVTRLIVLLGPLTYYTVTGCRLKWSGMYYFFYISSAISILVHMYSIIYTNSQAPSESFPNAMTVFVDVAVNSDEDQSSLLDGRRLIDGSLNVDHHEEDVK